MLSAENKEAKFSGFALPGVWPDVLLRIRHPSGTPAMRMPS